MKRKIVAILACVAALSLLLFYLGSQRRVLENASKFTLYSLQPSSDLYSSIHRDANAFRNSKPQFRRHVVLGQTEITDAKIKALLIESLYRGMEEDAGFAACFNPRHAIRAQWGVRTVDVVICFECRQVRLCELGFCGKSKSVSLSPQPIFDRVLKQNNVPLGLRQQK